MPRLIAVLCATILAGCTAVRVEPIDADAAVTRVCIEQNPKVIVADFLTVVQDGFTRHGIETVVVSAPVPADCEYVLTYTALQSWDFVTYLSHAELRLRRDGRQVAYAEYHLTGKGGLSLMKWQGTRTKMDPVIDQLLIEYPAGTTAGR